MSTYERDSMFDNIKAIMLFLVAVGHILDVYFSKDSFYRHAMQYIYLFHMPVFAFVTGYFCKNMERQRARAVRTTLVPYVILQSVYCVMALAMIYIGLGSHNADVFVPSLVMPTSPLYYLLCVFFWKVFAKDIMNLRVPFIMSIIMGALNSMTQYADWHIGAGATFTLLPFFVLGLKWDAAVIERIRSQKKGIPIVIMLLGIVPAVVLPYRFRNVRFSYEDVGLSALQGILYRLLFYAIAIALLVAILALAPKKKNRFTRIGTHAIMVYAGSSFLSPHGYVLLTKFVPQITGNTALNFLCICVYSFAIVYICSLPFIMTIYKKIEDTIVRLVFQEG